MKTILIIDGNGIMFRAYFALPHLTTTSGKPTNAIYGFFSMLQKALIDFHPDQLIICFDAPGPSFRNDLLKDYQAQRPKIDEDFRVQIPIIKELVQVAGMAHIEMVGYEADDLIGTLATQYKKDHQVFILSADKDLLQLVDDKITVIAPKVGISTIAMMTPVEVREKFGLTEPWQIADLKALTGDSADNYKGAKGIGPKTASILIKKFGTVEEMLKRTDEIEPERIRNIIENDKENILVTKKVSTIVKDIPLSLDDSQTHIISFNEAMKQKIAELQMFGLAKKLFSTKTEHLKTTPPKKQSTPSDQIGLF